MDDFLGISGRVWNLIILFVTFFYIYRGLVKIIDNHQTRIADLENRVYLLQNPHLDDD